MVGPSSIKGSGVRDRVVLFGVVGHGDDRAALLRNGGITVADRGSTRVSPLPQPRSVRSGRIVFLRGHPSPIWLDHLGASFDIDPELYYRHLDPAPGILPGSLRSDWSYPTPPPTTRDIIQLRLCNTGTWIPDVPKLSLDALRTECAAEMEAHMSDFIRLRKFSTGDSIVRRMILHDLHSFSLEQKISIEVIYHTSPWSIIVWLDCGRDLSRCTRGPWLNKFSMTDSVKLNPIYQHRSRMALSNLRNGPRPVHDCSNPDAEPEPLFQSINHTIRQYGSYLKSEIMANDAFYALHELFEISAASIDQVLEIFEANIQATARQPNFTRLSELLILKTYIDDYRGYLQGISNLIAARGNPRWPKTADQKQSEKTERAAKHLEARYRNLLQRCHQLAQQCASSITILMNLEGQRQTEKVIEQTDRLKKLSVLAYVYIPLTFAASFFGMNFAELGTELSIWSYFLFAVPLLFISMIAWFLDVRSMLANCWNSLCYYLS
ncbi:hypothetical protein PG985_014683 [Apiospora marii]|uniref:uncharacterized protein n=1 Tax=Apiospora marii TaxID=335849 RepID=UPI00313277AE